MTDAAAFHRLSSTEQDYLLALHRIIDNHHKNDKSRAELLLRETYVLLPDPSQELWLEAGRYAYRRWECVGNEVALLLKRLENLWNCGRGLASLQGQARMEDLLAEPGWHEGVVKEAHAGSVRWIDIARDVVAREELESFKGRILEALKDL